MCRGTCGAAYSGVVMMVVESAPLSWRISPVQIALLILIATPCAAINLYWHPNPATRAVTLAIGVVALVMAFASFRMYLVVDDEGIAVRYIRREEWLPWDEVAELEVVSGVRGSDTIRIRRTDGGHVDVPPSLLQPSKPTARPVARKLLEDAARLIEERRPGHG